MAPAGRPEFLPLPDGRLACLQGFLSYQATDLVSIPRTSRARSPAEPDCPIGCRRSLQPGSGNSDGMGLRLPARHHRDLAYRFFDVIELPLRKVASAGGDRLALSRAA